VLDAQAVADARGAADAQEAWLKANMAPWFARKLLRVVKRIEQQVAPHDSDPTHQFPRLAGSYLSEVRAAEASHAPNPMPKLATPPLIPPAERAQNVSSQSNPAVHNALLLVRQPPITTGTPLGFPHSSRSLLSIPFRPLSSTAFDALSDSTLAL
jgi:hypothetical protein